MTERTIDDLVEEMVDCVIDCSLSIDETNEYVVAFVKECGLPTEDLIAELRRQHADEDVVSRTILSYEYAAIEVAIRSCDEPKKENEHG